MNSPIRYLSFWPLQAAGWLCYAFAAAVTFFPFRHLPSEVAFRGFYVVDTFLASFAMYALCRWLWDRSVPLLKCLAWCVPGSYLLGVLCVVPAIWAQAHFGHPQPYTVWSLALANGTGAAFVLMAWAALFFGFKHFKALETHRELLLVSEATARRAQLKALQYQLQPHFLFNTLNAISSLVVSNKPQLATETLSRLADLLRSTLRDSETYTAPLDEEIDVIHQYLEIERLRFGPRLSVKLDIDEGLQSARIPRFILQPLVENAIRHGVERTTARGDIQIHAATAENLILIQIANDTPLVQNDGNAGYGVGLENCRVRLHQLYGDRASLTTEEGVGRFSVTIRIPADQIFSPHLL